MKKSRTILLFLVISMHGFFYANARPQQKATDTIPAFLKGNFIDDYSIRYNINDTLWTQLPNVKYHIINCDTIEQYLLARNDDENPSEPGLYTRIDYMAFSGLMPFQWGFCLTVYNAKTIEEAKMKSKADRKNPKKGCN